MLDSLVTLVSTLISSADAHVDATGSVGWVGGGNIGTGVDVSCAPFNFFKGDASFASSRSTCLRWAIFFFTLCECTIFVPNSFINIRKYFANGACTTSGVISSGILLLLSMKTKSMAFWRIWLKKLSLCTETSWLVRCGYIWRSNSRNIMNSSSSTMVSCPYFVCLYIISERVSGSLDSSLAITMELYTCFFSTCTVRLLLVTRGFIQTFWHKYWVVWWMTRPTHIPPTYLTLAFAAEENMRWED